MHTALSKFIRAADYLSAAQIYLRDNFLLTEPLQKEHIKPRLLGHWGTCPGINFTYAHLNRAIIAHDLDMLFVLGPGHGFPAIQANLFLEGTLSHFYPEIPQTTIGIAEMASRFSWPYGFPSHSNPEAPGVILEGGELGYALATSYGAALDNPDLIVTCLIGDGEAETGPTATAWHLSKLIDPGKNGAVLPILHLNGYKISGPTFYGRMNDEELTALFTGYGYEPIFVDAYEASDVHTDMIRALDTAIESIHFTQHCAREGTLHKNPRWPMIILRSPKGWHSIKQIRDKRIEDNHYSHQVIAENALHDEEEFRLLEEWLRSYRFNELFVDGGFDPDIASLIPRVGRKMGSNPHAHGGAPHFKPLKLPELADYSIPQLCNLNDPICGAVSSMEQIGAYLRDTMRLNEGERNLRLFSPDETYSNKLQAVFEHTSRAFVWPHKAWDKNIAWDGRVLEMLSEHSLQGLIQGYVLTGRHGVFASYEAFVQIVASMADQYAKFLKIAREVKWRGTIPSLNYILTSTGWRQEHNGFSHQNPGFIDGVLQRQGRFSNVYFPADANTALAVFKRMLGSTREVNVLVCEKRPLPIWRTQVEAERDVEEGVAIWDFASDPEPDVVFAAAGDYPTQEVLAAVSLVRQDMPALRTRFVNITSLSALGIGNTENGVSGEEFTDIFTADKKIIINFHGYPQTMKQILFDYGCTAKRVSVHGYEEVGSTTTAFDMMVRNRVDRFHLAMEAFKAAAEDGVVPEAEATQLIQLYENKLSLHRQFILEHGDDPEEITNWDMAVTLIVNPGSSSKKYALYVDKVLTLSAYVEKAESGGYVFCASVRGVDSLPGISISAAEYHESLDTFLRVAVEKKLLTEKTAVTTIALRIVAPGSYFQRHRVVDVEFIRELEAMIGSAPLHIPHVISELQAIQRLLPKVQTVAISDSAFHRTMPDMARQFSIPAETQGRYDLYRFGYHGLSVASVVRRLHAVTGEMPKRAIVCHIGSGVSVTALRSGLSIDTTMGYAPGSGLMMGTRAGDLDTGALLALMQARNLKPLDAQAFLQTQGGLRAVASEADLRLILDRRTKGDKEALLAVDTFVYQIQKAIGSYVVALGGIDQIIFTATASERSPILRSLICAPLGAIGVTLDIDKNEMCLGRDGVISTFTSPVKVVVMKADEAGEILALVEQVGVE